MTIEKLASYRPLQVAIESLNEEIEALYTPVSSISFDRYYKQTQRDTDGSTVRTLRKIEARREQLQMTLNHCIELTEEIENWLSGIPDQMVVSIVRYHYILGKTWVETSYKIYGHYGSANACRMTVKRYIASETKGKQK